MDMLLLSQEEFHPFYQGINSYFYEAINASPQPAQDIFSRPPPLGITLLASHLNRNGFSSVPVHNFFTREDSKRLLIRLLQEHPFAVGISTTHIFNRSMMDAISGLVKQLSPASRLIVGGPGSEWNTGLRPEGAITVLGPGEDTLLSLLKALKSGAGISSIPNLSYRENGRVTETPRSDNFPLGSATKPDWGLYSPTPKRVSLQGSRGCRHSCGFCSYPGGFSSRGPGSVMDEIRNNRQKWDINFFRFTDADLAADKTRAMELCGALEADGGYSWTCFARADSLLDRSLISAMKRAGCLWVFLGIESGSDKLLRAMNKGCSLQTMRKAIAGLREASIGVHGNFVVGYPGEDPGTLDETLNFIRGSGLDTVYFSPFQIRSMKIPVYQDRASHGLQGDFYSWRHDSMTSDVMLASTNALMEEVWRHMDSPVLTNEVFFSFFSSAGGPGFRENVLDFSRALRDWHRAKRSGNDLLRKSSAERIGAHIRAFA